MVLNEILLIEINPIVTQKHEFGYRCKLNLISIFRSFREKESDTRIKINDFSIETTSTVIKLYIEIIVEERSLWLLREMGLNIEINRC